MSDEILKVFILEDMPVDLELIKRQVRKYAPEVLFAVARNRTEFQQKIFAFEPDIVLSDYNLPDMNGLEALLAVRERLGAIPFIFITGILNDEEKVAEAILNGASGYLLKDKLTTLPDLLKRTVKQHRAFLAAKDREWEKRREQQLELRRAIARLNAMEDPTAQSISLSLQHIADQMV